MPASKASPNQLFDRSLVRQRRNRAARRFEEFDFLLRRCEVDLLDRLRAINVERFQGRDLTILILGCHTGFGEALREVFPRSNLSLVLADSSPAMAGRAASGSLSLATVVCDEEWLPFDSRAFDIILAPLTLHFVNDLPGSLIQIRRSLKDGGLFLSALLGGETLSELRHALSEAEVEIEGGLSPRVIPFTDVKSFGALLQRAGFHEPVSDMDRVQVDYSSFDGLLRDLRGMGLTNPMTQRRKKPMSEKTRARAKEIYEMNFTGSDGLAASFHILYGTAWASEPKPKTPA